MCQYDVHMKHTNIDCEKADHSFHKRTLPTDLVTKITQYMLISEVRSTFKKKIHVTLLASPFDFEPDAWRQVDRQVNKKA